MRARRAWSARVGATAALAAALLAAGACSSDEPPDVRLSDPGAVTFPDDGIPVARDATGEPLPKVSLESLAGDPVELTELTGQPLVLNIWYRNCPPCRKEMPAFEAAHRALGDEVRFVGINPADSAERAREFADEIGVTYDIVLDPVGEAVTELGVIRFPTTVFVGADGRIVEAVAGELDEAEILDKAQALLG